MTDKPTIIDEMRETDVYVARLELRSVGSSKNMYPHITFSHHFTEEPDLLPYSYLTILTIAEKMGIILTDNPTEIVDNPDEMALAMEEMNSGEGDDTVH